MDYSDLQSRMSGMSPAAAASFLRWELPQTLADRWCDAFQLDNSRAEIVSVALDRFTYLFDLTSERNIAAYGLMGGRNALARDKRRMAGHPMAHGKAFHRGHMIPHSGGGGADINLFTQRGSLNIGPFRELERLAVANPGAFYFVHLIYRSGGPGAPPSHIEQGLFIAAPPRAEIRSFAN